MTEEIETGILKKIPLAGPDLMVGSVDSGVYIYKGEYKKTKALLKIVPLRDTEKIKKQQREILVSKIIINHNNLHPNQQIPATETLASGELGGFFWVIRKYINGDSLSGTREIKKGVPLVGYDYIKDEYLDSPEIVKIILLKVLNVQSINSNLSLISKLDKRFVVDFDDSECLTAGKALDISLSKQASFFNQFKEEYFDKKNRKPCHGDLNPANIIIDNAGNVFLTDFEYFCLENYMIDYTFLWLYLWRYPRWQEAIEQCIHTEDWEFFRASIIRLTLPMYLKVFGRRNYHYDENVRRSHRSHVWLKYLIAAGESYETILKVKK